MRIARPGIAFERKEEQEVNPVIARVIAAFGVVLGLVSIWTRTLVDGESYWRTPHHAVGIIILVLAIVAGVGVLLASVQGSPAFDRLWVLAGTTLGGLLCFIPISAMDYYSVSALRTGGWIGAASLLMFLVAGALLPFSPSGQPRGIATQPASAPATLTGDQPTSP